MQNCEVLFKCVPCHRKKPRESLQVIHYIHVYYLARSQRLPKGLYILLALMSFFFFFFNDRSENNYLRIHMTDFHDVFFTK